MQAVWVPWLHMHQPLVWSNGKLISNLQKMLESKDSKECWDAKLMARAYKNPAKYVINLKEKGLNPKVMLDFSGILLEALQELSSSSFFNSVRVGDEVIGDIIAEYKKALRLYPDAIEFAGTAYAHCYFPATPEEDWAWQIEEWRNTFSRIFGETALRKVKGFWLPEMGIIGYEDRLSKLIKLLKENGYEWLILPLYAVKGYRQLSYEKRISIAVTPHELSVGNESITVVFSVPYYFLDQQAGVSAEYIYKQAVEAKRIIDKDKPALVITASDGENGNVMMNEFFPQTFTDFFSKYADEKVGSMTVSEFLKKFYEGERLEKVEIELLGASWIGGHERWILGEKRSSVLEKLRKASERVHALKGEELQKAKKLLLIAETSCYVYWGTDWWFSQGEKILAELDKIFKTKQ